MCGIAGIISSDPRLVTGSRLLQMTDSLRHRGPDGVDHWINKHSTAGLGHRRLAIIDLSPAAAQPMHYLQRYCIVYNGEIYNYIELHDVLARKGYRFTTASDTEVILAAFDHWRYDCLQHFDGMFAFGIWDQQEHCLFAARDRMGEKPFYYHVGNHALLFASEMKALWAVGTGKTVNNELLYNYLTLGYTQNPADAAETACTGILKLPAASYFIYKPGGPAPNTIRYWQPEPGGLSNSAADVITFTDLFTASVRLRLRSDVKLGTSLSGGLDSSAIAATIIQQTGNRKLETFSAFFPGFPADESEYVRSMAAGLPINSHAVYPSAQGLVDDFDRLCYFQEEFFGSASVYAQYKVFELARQHGVKVLLDGQGADEVLAGYTKYYHWYWQELYRNDRHLLRQELSAARQLGVQDNWSWKNKLAATMPSLSTSLFSGSKRRKQRSWEGMSAEFVQAFGRSYYRLPEPGRLENVLRYNSFENGLEELLRYADRNSMANGREVRLPFLQHQLLSYIFSLPAQMKIRNGRTKWILRTAMDGMLPKSITWRTDKVGFEPPQKQWMEYRPLQERIMAAKQQLAAANVLNASWAAKKIQPQSSIAADNFDWRCLVAATLFYR